MVKTMATVKKIGFDSIRRNAGGTTASQDEIVERRLRYLGEEMCNHARTVTPNQETGGYNDHTKNLRSSIGYAICHNGEIVTDGGFQSVGGTSGVQAAKDALSRYIEEADIPVVGWALVMVAGMEYATYVEAKGYNVLELTERELQGKIAELKKELGLK